MITIERVSSDIDHRSAVFPGLGQQFDRIQTIREYEVGRLHRLVFAPPQRMRIAFLEIRNSSQHFVTYPFNELDRPENATCGGTSIQASGI